MGHLGSWGLRGEEGKEGGRREEKAKSSALKSNNLTLKGGEKLKRMNSSNILQHKE